MNTTIAHRPHMHVPWTAVVVAALAIAAVAAVALILAYQPSTTTTTTQVVPATAGAAAVPMPETLALRRAILEAATVEVPAVEPLAYTRNHVKGATLVAESGYVTQPDAPLYLPGEVPADAHPLNHFAGQPR